MAQPPAERPIVHVLDDYDLSGFTRIAAGFGMERFDFVVTPNVDHMIRYHDEGEFRASYADAGYVLLDSRLVARLVRLTKGLTLRVCTGSDLTSKLFSQVIRPADRIVLIGGSAAQAQQLSQRYGLTNVRHLNPPMGFIRDPAAVEACLEFVENNSPFRFCFLAIGSPQQEVIAQALKGRGRARGLALCVGASLNFITGVEKRAPLWMQRLTLEWLYRLLQDPKRLARRYLLRGPRIFNCLRHDGIQIRRRDA